MPAKWIFYDVASRRHMVFAIKAQNLFAFLMKGYAVSFNSSFTYEHFVVQSDKAFMPRK
jgi:hypothetical protein